MGRHTFALTMRNSVSSINVTGCLYGRKSEYLCGPTIHEYTMNIHISHRKSKSYHFKKIYQKVTEPKSIILTSLHSYQG